MEWDAWLLLAKSRAEDAVKAKASAIRKKLFKLEKAISDTLSELSSTLSTFQDLKQKLEGLMEQPHALVRRLAVSLGELNEKAGRAEELMAFLMKVLPKWPTWAKEVNELLDKAIFLAKSGDGAAAFDLAIHASSRLSEVEGQVRPMLEASEGLVAELKEALEAISNGLARLEHEASLLEGLSLDLRGELVRLVRPCSLPGLGSALLVLTDGRLLVLNRLGRVALEAPRDHVEVLRVKKGLLGSRARLLLAISSHAGRTKLTISCGKKDLKAILMELEEGGMGHGA